MSPPTYSDLLSALTLGTARRELRPNIRDWVVEKSAVDPTADDAERLLAALSLIERSHRLRERTIQVPAATDVSAPESRSPPDPRLARGLGLIFDGTYPQMTEEAVDLIHKRGTYLPAPLLPALLLRAAALAETDYPRALRYLAAGGERGKWLARRHPDWHRLEGSYDFATAYRSELQPGKKAILLRQWRHHDPDAARAALEAGWKELKPRSQEILLTGMEAGLSPADHDFLHAALGPKRKGVRRGIARLLLLAGDTEIRNDWTNLARASLNSSGQLRESVTRESQDSLLRYGGTATGQRLPNRLLEVLPPRTWEEITGKKLRKFWRQLGPLELRDAGRAIVSYGDDEVAERFVRHLVLADVRELPTDLATRLVDLIAPDGFTRMFERVLTEQEDALRLQGPARRIALLRRGGWSERLTRALMTRLIRDLEERHLDYGTQRLLAEQWRSAVPRVHPATFTWLRQRLQPVTERYDAFGKLATELLQTTSFRRSLR